MIVYSKAEKKRGFTIVELLIVIVVIAILAAITIVAYNSIQSRANDSAVSADISAIRTKFELTKVDLGHYPQNFSQFPSDFKFSKSAYDQSQSNVFYVADIANDTYAFGLRSKPLKGYILTQSGLQEGVTVTGPTTASALGVGWGAAGTFSATGYDGTAKTWYASWSWTN